MHFLGESVSDDDVRAMIQEADADHDGLVDFEVDDRRICHLLPPTAYFFVYISLMVRTIGPLKPPMYEATLCSVGAEVRSAVKSIYVILAVK
ncbi:hypothetical protein TSMEX_002910 [Taenia solium]